MRARRQDELSSPLQRERRLWEQRISTRQFRPREVPSFRENGPILGEVWRGEQVKASARERAAVDGVCGEEKASMTLEAPDSFRERGSRKLFSPMVGRAVRTAWADNKARRKRRQIVYSQSLKKGDACLHFLGLARRVESSQKPLSQPSREDNLSQCPPVFVAQTLLWLRITRGRSLPLRSIVCLVRVHDLEGTSGVNNRYGAGNLSPLIARLRKLQVFKPSFTSQGAPMA